MTARQNYKKYGNPNNAKRKLNKISACVKSFFVILRLIFENAFSVKTIRNHHKTMRIHQMYELNQTYRR